jgi:hypothetical protein
VGPSPQSRVHLALPSIPGNELGQGRARARREGKCLSSDSVQSSSGVSSNGSLHLSIGSEFEPAAEGPGGVVTVCGLAVPSSPHLAPSPAAPPPPPPSSPLAARGTPPVPPRGHHHVSTTYITGASTTYITQDAPRSVAPPSSPAGARSAGAGAGPKAAVGAGAGTRPPAPPRPRQVPGSPVVPPLQPRR